jgi:putative transposase
MFRSVSDYELYLDSLRYACTRLDVAVDGYALMTTHSHLLLTPASKTAIAGVMQAVGRRYVYHFNRRYGRTGGLFDGRYRSIVVDSERYWFTCLRYVELNPVCAGLVAAPDQYRWSSYAAHALGRSDPLIAPHALYVGLGTTPRARQSAWREACGASMRDDELEEVNETIRRGWLRLPSATSQSRKKLPPASRPLTVASR